MNDLCHQVEMAGHPHQYHPLDMVFKADTNLGEAIQWAVTRARATNKDVWLVIRCNRYAVSTVEPYKDSTSIIERIWHKRTYPEMVERLEYRGYDMMMQAKYGGFRPVGVAL